MSIAPARTNPTGIASSCSRRKARCRSAGLFTPSMTASSGASGVRPLASTPASSMHRPIAARGSPRANRAGRRAPRGAPAVGAGWRPARDRADPSAAATPEGDSRLARRRSRTRGSRRTDRPPDSSTRSRRPRTRLQPAAERAGGPRSRTTPGRARRPRRRACHSLILQSPGRAAICRRTLRARPRSSTMAMPPIGPADGKKRR